MKIEILYSEVANLFGDMANVRYLEKCLPKAKFIYTSLNDKPKFISEKIDLVYMGPMSENSQELVIEALGKYKNNIKEAIKNKIHFLITGNAIEIFGKYIENEDGSKVKGLGLYNIHSKREMMKRYNSIELGTFKDMEIVGFKSSFTQIYGEGPKFLDIKRGYGDNKESKVEGINDKNFIATTLLGPILIINPYFTKYLLGEIGYKDKILYEDELVEAYNKRVIEFKDPKRNLD